MTGHRQSAGPGSALSSDSVRRVTQYPAGANARLGVFALLERRVCPRARRTTWWPGRSARWWSWTAWCRLLGCAVFTDGWDKGVMAVCEALGASRAGTGPTARRPIGRVG